MYYSVCKGIVIFWKHQRFLDKNVWRTQFCDKAFVVLLKIVIFAPQYVISNNINHLKKLKQPNELHHLPIPARK